MVRISKNRKAGFVIATCVTGLAPTVHADSLLVDIGQDNGRKDALSPRAVNWSLKAAPTASYDLGNGIKATLTAVGEKSQIQGAIWKGGLDVGATVATDGVIATEGGKIRLTITGLSKGKHTLATFHNALDGKNVGPVQVVDISKLIKSLPKSTTPSKQVTSDDGSASAFFEFQGPEITIEITPVQAGAVAVLNGFEIDGSNPKLRASQLSPADDDEHAADKPELTWTAGENAVAHRVFLGESKETVAKAEAKKTADNSEYKGELAVTKYAVPASLDHMKTYYWRVDEVQKDGSVVRGRVASFRVRHLAFPGAEGYGRFARGGRGGRVIEVTNLEDSGEGSLRAAVEAEGPRTVVFRVGGMIKLKSRLTIKNPYITIAGQTAPGDGIGVRDAAFGMGGTHDAIMRFIRIRVGDASGTTWDGTGFGASDHAIIDHCSVAWSIDEGVSGRGAKNISFQRNIIAEPLHQSIHDHYNYEAGSKKGHGFAGSISGDIGSFHHNLIANSAGRNFSLAGGFKQSGDKFGGRLDIRNNVVYNWYHRTNDGGVQRLNLAGNYYIPGAASQVFRFAVANVELPLATDTQEYYISGNVMEGYPQYDADNWKNGGVTVPEKDTPAIRSDKPFWDSYITPHSAREAYASIMADVGANIPAYDSIDQRAIQNTLTRTTTFKGSKTGLPGIPDSQNDVGGYPEMKNGVAPADNDHDGMADWWEKERGLNPANPEDRNLIGADGYTNLELYLNWIVENGGLTPKAGHVPAAVQAEQAVLKLRAEKITAQLGIEDKEKAARVTKIIADQYQGLHTVLSARENKLRAYEAVAGGAKSYGGQTYENVLIEAYAEAQPKLQSLHKKYLEALYAELTPSQVLKVKDEMTDNRLSLIYKNFNEMVPDLTAEQKAQIMANLVEARERAMDTVNDQQRRQWFSKYIGRSNNYIARQGHDFKKLASDWKAKTGANDVM